MNKKDFAVAVAVKRKNKKKMAEGGTVKEHEGPPSAKGEARPMPMRMDDSGKAPKQDSWTDQPTVAQAQRPSKVPLSRPKMVGSDAFSVRDRDAADAEDMRKMSSEAPASPKMQPPKHMDEMGPDRKGPSVPALKMKMMAEGGMLPKGSEATQVEHPAGLESDNDQMRPKSQEYMDGYMAGRYAQGGEIHDTEEDYSDKPDKGWGAIVFKAEGGAVDPMDDSSDIDLDEMEDERHSSIAAAIMAKKDRMKGGSDSNEDHMEMMADGGILSHGSMDSDDSDQADLSRNADEDANEEDQASFNALRKENYSESEGLAQLDSPMDSNEMGDESEDESENKHDMVGAIRRKMSMKRKFR